MATLLLSFKRNSDSHIVIHGFLTPNETESEKDLKDHAAACPKFGPAVKAGNTIEQTIDVDTIPKFDEVSIGEWLDANFGLADEEEPGEDEDEEEEEDEDEEKE